MLYGYRPYGEGKTQENVWSEGLIFNASQVEFPTDPKAPKVSDEAKDLIRACLSRDHRLRFILYYYLNCLIEMKCICTLNRPDVMTVCQHQYLKSK